VPPIRRTRDADGGVELDPQADGRHHGEAARRANELDRHELDHLVQLGLFDAFYTCPRPMPRRFFPWLKATLALAVEP
jgi:hypothetical protein